MQPEQVTQSTDNKTSLGRHLGSYCLAPGPASSMLYVLTHLILAPIICVFQTRTSGSPGTAAHCPAWGAPITQTMVIDKNSTPEALMHREVELLAQGHTANI